MEHEPGKLHVVFALYQGVVQDIRLAQEEQKANEIERELCEEYEVPYNEKAREKYYDETEAENEVHHLVDVEVE